MILCLTYHKILASDSQKDDDFYSVTQHTLAAQIEAALAAGYLPIELSDPAPVVAPEEKRLLLTFDDGTADHYGIVAPLLQKLRLRGVFFVPTAKLNQPGYLTEDQLAGLAKNHMVGCHSHIHRRLDTLPSDQLEEQLRISCERLAHICGVPPRTFAPPGGFITPNILEAALKLGLPIIRTMRWGFNRQLNWAALETIPINRHTASAGQFQKILQGKQPHFLYLCKEIIKTMVPLRAYEQMRQWLFKAGRRS